MDIIHTIGSNPGIDGHLCKSKGECWDQINIAKKHTKKYKKIFPEITYPPDENGEGKYKGYMADLSDVFDGVIPARVTIELPLVPEPKGKEAIQYQE